jgi:integrase
MVSDILEDEPDSLVDKRDRAIGFLALHLGLRTVDIRNLKFSDIDWGKKTLKITQSKTGVQLEMPIDNETENAIIDYVLNERRDCKLENIFITAVGPAQKLARHNYRIKYRAKDAPTFDKIPHDGLHVFRRTFASRLLQCGVEVSMISDMLGHIDKNTAQRYLSTDEVKMKRCALNLSAIPYRRGDF